MKPAKPVKRFWLVAALMTGGIFVAIAANVFAVRSIIANWRTLSISQRDLAASEAERARISGDARSLATLSREQSAIEDAIVDPANPLPFIETIEELGRRLGVRSNLAIANGTGAKPDSFEVTADGPFLNVYSFLQGLESLPFLVEFGDVELRRIGGGLAEVASRPDGALSSATVRLTVLLHIVKP